MARKLNGSNDLTKVLRKIPVRTHLFFSRFRRGMTLGVRAAAFDREGRVFLVRHSYTPGWYLPGGGVEPGETSDSAIARELMEEGGIALDAPPELFGLYLNRAMSRRDHVALYLCRHISQPRPPAVPNLEIVDCGFFQLDGLPEGTTEATGRRIAEIGGAARSPHW
jgi:8-oxo-dGTP pyrophosphatase MutT (NUDIX family)